METIPSDVYVLRNVHHLSFATFVNDNDNENAVSETAPTGGEPAKPIGHKWKITANQNGTYDIFNEMHEMHARISGDSKTVESTRNAASAKAIWRIMRIPGESGFLIRDLNASLCWKLSRADTRTPIELVAPSAAKDSMWTFESRLTRYPSRTESEESKIPSKVLQERDNLLGNGGTMPIFDFQANKAPAHKLDIVVIQPAPIVGMVPAYATLSRIAESMSRLANKNSLFVDARLGAITYTAVGNEAFSSIFHFATFDRLNKAEISGFLPRSEDYFTAALRDALNMDWRHDAAKMVIFAPLAGPSGTADYHDSEYQRNELIKQLKARNILFTVNADEAIREQYMGSSPFFRTLKNTALNESASIPQNLLMGWTFASTFYKNDISTLLDAFGLIPKKPNLRNPSTNDSPANSFYSRRTEESDCFRASETFESRSTGPFPNDQGGKGQFHRVYTTTEFPPRGPPNVRRTPPLGQSSPSLEDMFANMERFDTFDRAKRFPDDMGDGTFFRETFVQTPWDRPQDNQHNNDFQSNFRGFPNATGFPTFDHSLDSQFSSGHAKGPSRPSWFGSGFPSMSSSSSTYETSWKSGGAESNASFQESSARRGWNRDGYASG